MSKLISFISTPTSAGHSYGNVTAFVTEKIKSWFHKDYFKTVNVSGTLAAYNYNLIRTNNKGIFKKEKPYLVIVPKAVIDSEIFMNNTLMTNRFSEDVPGFSSGNLFTFIDDKEKGLAVKYLVNRDKIVFDVSIFVETGLQQLNMAKMIRNRVIMNKPLNWYTNLECHIPREIMSAMSYISEIPLTEPAKLLEYANGHSDSPVTYMLKNSTGNDEYFKYYNAQVDVLITDMNLSDANKKNMTDDYFSINFTVEAEFYTIGEFFVYTKQSAIPGFYNNAGDFKQTEYFNKEDVERAINNVNKSELEMIFTPYENVGINVSPGWGIVAESSFKVEKRKPDIVNLKPLLHERIIEVINWHIKNNITLDKLLEVHVMRDNGLLNMEEGDYIIDFETLELLVYKVVPVSTYRIVLVMNNAYMNELAIENIK